MKKEQKNMKQKVKRTIMYFIKQDIVMFHCYKAMKIVRVFYRNYETKWIITYFQFQM